jgi:hypothetical protein
MALVAHLQGLLPLCRGPRGRGELAGSGDGSVVAVQLDVGIPLLDACNTIATRLHRLLACLALDLLFPSLTSRRAPIA